MIPSTSTAISVRFMSGPNAIQRFNRRAVAFLKRTTRISVELLLTEVWPLKGEGFGLYYATFLIPIFGQVTFVFWLLIVALCGVGVGMRWIYSKAKPYLFGVGGNSLGSDDD